MQQFFSVFVIDLTRTKSLNYFNSEPFFELIVPGILKRHDINDGLCLLSPLLFVNIFSAYLKNCSDGSFDNSLNSLFNSKGLISKTM